MKSPSLTGTTNKLHKQQMRAGRRGGGWREEEGVEDWTFTFFLQTNWGVQLLFSLCGRKHHPSFSTVTFLSIYKSECLKPRRSWWIFSRGCGSNYGLCQKPVLWSWDPSLFSFCLLAQFSSWLGWSAVTASMEEENPNTAEYDLSEGKTENRLH